MKIQFVLPPNYNQPVGGYKVVFQYANWLSKRGHDVHIYFMRLREPFGKSQIRWFKRLVFGQNNPVEKITWFDINPNISLHYNVGYQVVEGINDGVIIATFWKTAISVYKSKTLSKNKFYFIQGFEVFSTSKENIFKTWHYPLKKIVVSNWLLEKVSKINEKATLIPNFIDSLDFYEVTEKIEVPTVSMLWHDNPKKGSLVGLRILKNIKKYVPELQAIFFGKGTPPENLPKWIKYYKNANESTLRNDIYGKSQVYLMPSEFEGWGLTAMESMAVGTPVVCFENGGIRNFSDDSSAIIVPVGDIALMETELAKLLRDQKRRRVLRNNSLEKLKAYTIDVSGFKMEKTLTKLDV